MSKQILSLSVIIFSLFFNSCIVEDDITIEKPGDAIVSMTIEKSFGEESSQVIKTVLKNEMGSPSELEDGAVTFNGDQMEWNHSNRAYYADVDYILNEEYNNIFEVTFPNGDIVTSEILTPLFIENVIIPEEINININTELTWEAGNSGEEILIVLWVRPLEMESWEIILNEKTPDDGSYMLLSTVFETYMGQWQFAIELIRGIQETPDPLFMDDSELYSIFVFGKYDGNLISN